MLESTHSRFSQLGHRDARRICLVDHQFSFTARVVQRNQPPRADRRELGEQDQGSRQLVEVVDTVHAVTGEQSIVSGIVPGNRAGMGSCESGCLRGPAHF